MTAQHTPGPWADDGNTIRTAAAPGWLIATIENAVAREANARLIAAAPALLAALELAESFMAGFEGDELQDDMDDHLATVRAAIALAHGAPTAEPAPPIAGVCVCARCGNTDQDGSDICPDCGEAIGGES